MAKPPPSLACTFHRANDTVALRLHDLVSRRQHIVVLDVGGTFALLACLHALALDVADNRGDDCLNPAFTVAGALDFRPPKLSPLLHVEMHEQGPRCVLHLHDEQNNARGTLALHNGAADTFVANLRMLAMGATESPPTFHVHGEIETR